MKGRFAAALAALLATLPAQAAEWTVMESEHFAIYTRGGLFAASSTDASLRRRALSRLEALRWLGLGLLGADERSVRAQPRTELYMLHGTDELKKLFPESPDATEHHSHCTEGAATFIGSEPMYRRGRREAWYLGTLQHTYAHHLISQYATVPYPAWFVEGYARYLGTAAYEDGTVTLGARELSSLSPLAKGAWLGWDELLNWQALPLQGRSAQDSALFAAQGWLLTHYMLADRERTLKLHAYFARLASGEGAAAAFEPATGVTLAELATRLQLHLLGMRLIEVKAAAIPEPPLRELDADADAVVLDAARLRTCPGAEQGRAMLDDLRQRAKADGGASPALQLVLARAEIQFGDAERALAVLEPAVAAEDPRAEAHYLLGRAWSRRAETLAGDAQRAAQDKARAALLKAYRLKKDDPPTLYHLARVLARNGVDNNVLNAARGARTLAPAVAEYAAFAAWAELQAGERDRALRTLAPLAHDLHRPELAARMQRAVEAIKAGKPAADVQALLAVDAGPGAR